MNEKKIYIASLKAYKCMLNLPRLAENKKLKQNRWAKEKRSGREFVRSVQWVSMVKSAVEKTLGRGVF